MHFGSNYCVSWETLMIFIQASEPKYIKESSTPCHFEFRWKTHHACPTYRKYNETTGEKMQGPTCKALDKNTNQR